MRTNDRLVGSRSRRRFEQFHETRLVRITQRTLAIWVDPLGMLDPEVVVNLLPKLGVGVDLVRRGHWLGERFRYDAWRFIQLASSMSARRSETNEFHKRLLQLGI